jgi:hypothetical protein
LHEVFAGVVGPPRRGLDHLVVQSEVLQLAAAFGVRGIDEAAGVQVQ